MKRFVILTESHPRLVGGDDEKSYIKQFIIAMLKFQFLK